MEENSPGCNKIMTELKENSKSTEMRNKQQKHKMFANMLPIFFSSSILHTSFFHSVSFVKPIVLSWFEYTQTHEFKIKKVNVQGKGVRYSVQFKRYRRWMQKCHKNMALVSLTLRALYFAITNKKHELI